MREAHDLGGDSFHLAVEFANFDLGAEGGVSDVEACEGDRLLENRRARAAGHHADLVAADEDAVAMHRQGGGAVLAATHQPIGIGEAATLRLEQP